MQIPEAKRPGHAPARRWLLALLLSGALAFAWVAHRQRQTSPQPVLPPDLQRLEPQLREYVLRAAEQVRQKPANYQAHLNLALIYAANGLWPEARAAFSQLIPLNTNEPLARLYFAVATQETGADQEAFQLYTSLVGDFPRFAPGFYRVGDLGLRLGRLDQAERAFEQLTALAPTEWRGYAGLGQVKLRHGLFAEAVRSLERALELGPGAKEAHHLLGLAYRGLNRPEEAERELRAGLNAKHYPMPDPWAAAAVQHLVLLTDQLEVAGEYLERGNPRTAIKILQNGRQWHPGNLELLNQLALAYQASDEFEEARHVLLEAIQLAPQNISALVSMSSVCLQLGLSDDALGYALAAVKAGPELPQGYLAQATVLQALKRFPEALAALEQALRADPRNGLIHLEIGELLESQLNKPEEALRHYRAALEVDPALRLAYARLAEGYLRLQQKEAFTQTLRQWTKWFPNDPARDQIAAGAPRE